MNRSITLAALLVLNSLSHADSPAEFFEKKVRPILVEQCFSCHAGKKVRGGLKMDGRPGLLKGGDTGPAVVPGEPAKSLLMQAISYREHLRMPPRSKLPDAQIADLTAWVKMGAPWPSGDGTATNEEKVDLTKRLSHWSFRPIRPSTPPAALNLEWTRTPIDQFVMAKLEAKRLSPAGAADRRTLLRRLTFDLTGLPPTIDEIRSFLDDHSPSAYEKVVDRLLASPAYGERWGRHWLDLMRFAETSGHEFDFEIPHASQYRDYVIRAFNDDVPYDQLVREHLAGDLLPSPRRHPIDHTNESILGTGFWFLGESKHSPVDLRGDGADRRDNMIDVFSKAFLGLTISCARCHDHKFDPITTREYYSLASYLQSSRMQRAFLDPPDRIGKVAAQIKALRMEIAKQAIKETARVLEIRVSEDPPIRQAKANGSHIVFEDFLSGDYRNWHVTGEAFGSAPAGPMDIEIDSDKDIPVRRVMRGANSGRVSPRLQGALRSKTFTISKKFIHFRARGNGVRINLIIDGFQQIRAPIYGELTFTVNWPDFRWHPVDAGRWQGLKAYIEILDDGDGEIELDQVVFSDQPGGPPTPMDGGKLETVRSWRDGKPFNRELLNRILATTPVSGGQNANSNLKRLQSQIAELEKTIPVPHRGLAMADGDAIEERVHIRGNPKTLGAEAPRVLPVAIAGARQEPSKNGSGRLMMAERVTSIENPLFARVIVNRLWHHHFGAGLVRSTDDFGHQGELPSHPELLDWLANEFTKSGGSLKHLHRLMVLSRTYQIASRSYEISEQADPRNEFLHRANIRRLEAEAIRDAMIAVSGRLDRTMFGKGPLPYLTDFMVGRGRPGHSGPLDGDGRRSVYLNVRRNFLTPMFLAFDYPTPFATIGRRGISNVPAQALTLLNNPFVLQQARLWTARDSGKSDRQRIRAMYEVAFGRYPSNDELTQAMEFVNGQGNDTQAWADLAHVLFNVKEFIFVN